MSIAVKTLGVGLGIALGLLAAGCSQDQAVGATAAKTERAPSVERGKYLVERVGMCADCHTPRNEKGEFIQEKWLMGAELDFAPTHPMPAWAGVAPAIAGLHNYSQEDAAKLLETGARPSGVALRPPMPGYRLNHEDAQDVTAYLKSLAK